MKYSAGEAMSTLDTYILGNDELHDRFIVATQILGKALSAAPELVTAAHLKQVTGRSAKEISKLCGLLALAGILAPEIHAGNAWARACDPAETTLEDVFLCVLPEQTGRNYRSGSKRAPPRHFYHEVDLLLVQFRRD
jgi:hypothetical protein